MSASGGLRLQTSKASAPGTNQKLGGGDKRKPELNVVSQDVVGIRRWHQVSAGLRPYPIPKGSASELVKSAEN